MKSFTSDRNTTLKIFTDETYPQGSFCISALLKGGDVRVNGKRVKSDCAVSAGDEIIYYTTPRQESKPSHNIVYEDENVYIADKLSGVSSEGLFSSLSAIAPYPVHRLDRNTQGLIVIAKTPAAEKELTAAFKQRQVIKTYLCLAKNAFKQRQEILTAYIFKDERQGKVSVYPTPADGRQKAVTEYEVLKAEGELALVKVTLHTGRTHQIRAHLSFIGCPLLGDTKYGDFALNKRYSKTRQQLISKELKFNLEGPLAYLNDINFESKFTLTLPD